MAKLLTDETAAELPSIFEAVRNMQQETHTRPRRRIRSLGGGTERAYVIITSVISPSSYIGNVLTSPTDSTVIATGVSIGVSGATANPFNVGYPAFSDKVDDVYYIDGYLLG